MLRFVDKIVDLIPFTICVEISEEDFAGVGPAPLYSVTIPEGYYLVPFVAEA